MIFHVRSQITTLRFIPLVFAGFALNACDSNNELPVQTVSDESVIADNQLKQAQQALKKTVDDQNTLYFGFDLRASPQEDAAQYLPFLEYLQRTTGLTFKLHFTAKNSSTVDDLSNNLTQLAAMGATSFLEAQSKFNAISLVRGLNHQNKAEYQSVFVVKPGSKIRRIEQIKGKRLAFGSRDSTQGHLIPRIMLTEKNIRLKDLRGFSYTGSHQNCAESVVSGKYDVCGMQDQLAKRLAAEGLITIIHTSEYYPSSGIVASPALANDIINKIQTALLNFEPKGKHQQGLYNWDNTEMPLGFTRTNANDYDSLRKWSIKLGFLELEEPQVKE